jgi:hypothetical protein
MSETIPESPCCGRERERQLRLIRDTYTAFPVIKTIPCPQCRQWIRLRVYEKPAVEERGVR